MQRSNNRGSRRGVHGYRLEERVLRVVWAAKFGERRRIATEPIAHKRVDSLLFTLGWRSIVFRFHSRGPMEDLNPCSCCSGRNSEEVRRADHAGRGQADESGRRGPRIFGQVENPEDVSVLTGCEFRGDDGRETVRRDP